MKIGTIGTGSIVSWVMTEALRADGMEWGAVCSRREETGRALAERFGVNKVYTDLDAMLADEALDFIYVASPNSLLHTPLQESSKTADDGASAPREWCGCSGCMVHSGRRHGAHGRRAFPLFGNTFALAHGFTLDLDGVGVVDDLVLCQDLVQVKMRN